MGLNMFGVSLRKFFVGIMLFLIYPILFATNYFFFTDLFVSVYDYNDSIIILTNSSVFRPGGNIQFVLSNTMHIITTSFLGLLVLLPVVIPLLVLLLKYGKIYDEEGSYDLAMYYAYPQLASLLFFSVGDYYITRNVRVVCNDLNDLLAPFSIGIELVIPFVVGLIMMFLLREWVSYECKKTSW